MGSRGGVVARSARSNAPHLLRPRGLSRENQGREDILRRPETLETSSCSLSCSSPFTLSYSRFEIRLHSVEPEPEHEHEYEYESSES